MSRAGVSRSLGVARDGRGIDLPDRVESLIERVAAVGDSHDGALRAFVAGGKRLRARLVVTVASLGGATDEETLATYAAFVELIHAGGLCHDDVVDRSTQRRLRASLASTHGVRAASFAGLHLMIGAYALVATAEPVVRTAIARAAERVAKGQADEMLDLHRCDVDPQTYVERCRAKTGALFELAAELGAAAARLGADLRERVTTFGAELGLAFQLVDDVRDLRGDAVIGRPAGTDLREGVYTLPVLETIRGAHAGGRELRGLLARIRSERDPSSPIAAARDLLKRNGSVAASLAVAADAVRRASKSIEPLPPAARCAFDGFVAVAVHSDLRETWRATAA